MLPPRIGSIFLLLPLGLLRGPGAPQPALAEPVVTWFPGHPVQGSLFTVRVLGAGDTLISIEGRLADEPLHFRTTDGAGWMALAAVPVDAPTNLQLELDISDAGGAHRIRRTVPIAPGRYAMEHLDVAPEFGAPLPPALQRRTEEESARAFAVARSAHETASFWEPGQFMRPRPGRITSGFGNGREFNGQVQSRHMGTDFAGTVGAPVLAPAPGVVALVDSFYLGGNVIYVDHGGGLSTGYLHLSETFVAPGDTVAPGQRIGSVGETGRVTGPHLHWIVRYGGVTVDPLSLFELQSP